MAFTKKIASASNNIPTSFDATAGSKLSGFKAGSRLLVLNYTTEILFVCVGEFSAIPSSSLTDNPNQLVVPAGSGGNPGSLVCDDILIGNGSDVYVRAASAASSGDVYVSVWVRS